MFGLRVGSNLSRQTFKLFVPLHNVGTVMDFTTFFVMYSLNIGLGFREQLIFFGFAGTATIPYAIRNKF